MSLYSLTTGKTLDGANVLQQGHIEGNILEALKRYSKARPRPLVADIAGDGGHDYALPAGWSLGLSVLESAEYPTGNLPETLIDKEEVKLYNTPAGTMLRFYLVTPKVGETIRICFTGLHTEATVPEADLEAVANLAASLCCRQLAQRYAGTSDSTIGADVVSYRSKGDEFARRAKELQGLFDNAIGIQDGDTAPPAMATVEPPAERRRGLWGRGRG
jgi:hypothetical protein